MNYSSLDCMVTKVEATLLQANARIMQANTSHLLIRQECMHGKIVPTQDDPY